MCASVSHRIAHFASLNYVLDQVWFSFPFQLNVLKTLQVSNNCSKTASLEFFLSLEFFNFFAICFYLRVAVEYCHFSIGKIEFIKGKKEYFHKYISFVFNIQS